MKYYLFLYESEFVVANGINFQNAMEDLDIVDSKETAEISLNEYLEAGGMTCDINSFGDYYKINGKWIQTKPGEYPPHAIEYIKKRKERHEQDKLQKLESVKYTYKKKSDDNEGLGYLIEEGVGIAFDALMSGISG